ncbi:MAG TPA: hypothetical protein PLT50_03205, partial [bacterium]|nr:hypothetical protein [bacterium]
MNNTPAQNPNTASDTTTHVVGVNEAALILKTSPTNLRRMEEQGKISYTRDIHNHRKYNLDEVEKLRRELEEQREERKLAQLEKREKHAITGNTTEQKQDLKRAKNENSYSSPIYNSPKTEYKNNLQDPFYIKFRNNIKIISAGFVMASLILMLFSGYLLTPPKYKSQIINKLLNEFDSAGGKIAQALNIQIRPIEPFTQKPEKEMMAAVLGTRNRNPQYQVEFSVPVLAKELVTFNKGITAEGEIQLIGTVAVNGATDFSGEITLNTLAKNSLETSLEVAGDATGTLSNITITNLAGLKLETIDDIDGNLLFITNGELVSGTLADLDTTQITELGTIGTGTWEADVISPAYGGTGLSSFAVGDLIYASGTNTLNRLDLGLPGNILTVKNGLPAWTEINSALGGNVFLNSG